ncbi:cytochrome c biogenesis CcdA family protein [Actinoplanes sp. G11-F43]|uniref:cytochrome c biogenesis CcdA family protein n=1 Tax=Actinoplanes sp. G11-F43 TaxID=3424130 RepID=UPI003D33E956
MGDAFEGAVTGGPMLLAIGAAVIAGLVSILSPCVLPLLPGYLSYVTGLAGSDMETVMGRGGATTVSTARKLTLKGKVLLGSLLFVLGFSAVFTLMVTMFANIFLELSANQRILNTVGGVLIIVLGIAFLGWIPGLQREIRISRMPSAGLLGAPVLGAVFAISWTPCIGPTLGAINVLAVTTGQSDRAAVLAIAFSLGLGLPFVIFGLFFRRLLGVFTAIRRNSRWVTRIGGGMLILVGLALVTGAWNQFLIFLLTTFDFGQGTLL